MTQETELPALPEPFDDWWEREGKAGNPFDLRRAFNAGRASAGPCGCREGECESKVGPRCRMANEVTTAAVLAERERQQSLHMRRLTGLWRFGREVLPVANISFEAFLFQLDGFISEKTQAHPLTPPAKEPT